MKTRTLLINITLLSALAGCGKPEQTSSTKVTNVNAYRFEKQTIGNCWIYAQVSWLESVIEREKGQSINVSESYWTYFDWSDKIFEANTIEDLATFTEKNGKKSADFNTGGWFGASSDILKRFGFLDEAEFNSSESSATQSDLQKRAKIAIERDLLSENSEVASLISIKPQTRTEQAAKTEKIRAYLDKIWEIADSKIPENERPAAAKARRLELIKSGIKNAEKTLVYTDRERTKKSRLFEYLTQWTMISYNGPDERNGETLAESKLKQKKVLNAVMRALNERVPVLMGFKVHFNALDNNFTQGRGGFSFEKLTDNPSKEADDIGGHMIMISDYTSKVIEKSNDGSPDQEIIFGHQDLTDKDLRAKAATGDPLSFTAKNSWGYWRPDRGLVDGKTELDIDFLLNPTAQDVTENPVEHPSLQYFVIPYDYVSHIQLD